MTRQTAGIEFELEANGLFTVSTESGLTGGTYLSVVTDVAGDGVTDATASIQSKLSAALAAGGGVVQLPPGTFIASGLTIASNVTLRGAGVAATTLKLKSGANVDLLTTVGYAGLAGGGTTGGPSKFAIQDITLDGNKAGNTSGWVCSIYGSAYRITNVEFWNGASGGVRSEWGPAGTDMEAQWLNFKIRDWKAGNGLDWAGPHDSQFTNGIVASLDSNITSGGSSVRAINLKGSAASGNAAGENFHNLHTWGRAHYGFYGDRSVFIATGCTAESAFTSNVLVGASGTIWAGGNVYGSAGGNGTVESGFQVGIAGVSSVSRCVITGVFMNNFAATSFPFDFDNTAGHNMIRAAGALSGATAWSKQSIFSGTAGDWIEFMNSDGSGAKSIHHVPIQSSFPGGVATRTKAGTPSDADFQATPDIGTIVVDTTALKIWVRTASATWKSVTVA